MKQVNFNPFPADANGQTIIDDIVDVPTIEQINKVLRQNAHRIPDEESIKTLRALRAIFYKAALFLETALPPTRERSLAVTKLDEARMWACNAATLYGKIEENLDN